MTSPYPVIDVDIGLAFEPESMGGKAKFWYRELDEDTDWLFKFPRPNTGEHWAEKIAAEVAACMEIAHARVELAVIEQTRGSVTESFTRRGGELFHGNQLLQKKVLNYDAETTFGQSAHTLSNIWVVLDGFESAEAATRAKRQFAEYLLLDAVIGNTDRHHENWGLQLKRTPHGRRGFLAPSFDHASSLGRELRDERRAIYLEENKVGHYSEKGRGGIYWSETERRGPSPLELVRRAARDGPEFFHPTVPKLDSLNENTLREIVGRVPSDWMSTLARKFAVELMVYNLDQLREAIT